jgi:DNA-binding transcriptional regulator YbjK
VAAHSRRTDPGRRDRIIDVTLGQIVEHGLASVTYRTVAQAADVPLGSMTYHFASRDAMVFAAFERFADESFAVLDQATQVEEGKVLDRLTRLVLTADQRPHERVLVAELYVLAYRDHRYAELMRSWMRRASGAIARSAPGSAARAVDAVQEGLTLQRQLVPEEIDEALVRMTLRAALELGTGDGSPSPRS